MPIITRANDQMPVLVLVNNFLFTSSLPQKQHHAALVHDLMFWPQEINARYSHEHLSNI